LTFDDDPVRNAREAEGTGVCDAATNNRFGERAMAVANDDRSSARGEACAPTRCHLRISRPVREYREHAMWADRHVCEGRDVCAGTHHTPLGE